MSQESLAIKLAAIHALIAECESMARDEYESFTLIIGGETKNYNSENNTYMECGWQSSSMYC